MIIRYPTLFIFDFGVNLYILLDFDMTELIQPRKLTQKKRPQEIFDYRTLRFVIGIIAFFLPFIVSVIASTSLSSISASYYTAARDAFVGMLFVVGGFLLAYNGHSFKQLIASKVAALAAIGIAIFPTACAECGSGIISVLHYVSAAALFIILAYFCLIPFRKNLRDQSGKRRLRSNIYLVCGIVMLLCIVVIAGANVVLSSEVVEQLRIVYWGEAIALDAFGFAWFVSGKALGIFAEPDEINKII